MSLVAPPSIINDKLLVQLNGAPYLKGKASGALNP